MARILVVLAVMSAFAGGGLGLRRLGWATPAAAPRLNAMALNVTVPAGVFLALHVFPVDRSLLGAPALMALLTFALWGLAELAGRALRLDARSRAVFVLAVTFGNTAFVGFPVVKAVLGDEGLSHAVLVDQVGAEPLAFTLGAIIAAAGAASVGERARWKRELVALLAFPPLWALGAGLAWSALGWPPLPEGLQVVLRWVSAGTVPLVMVALGLLVRAGALAKVGRAASAMAVLRLVVSPLLALVAARLTGLADLPTKVLTLESGMPTMMFTLVLVTRAGLDAELAAAFITASLLGAVVALPAWVAALGG